MNFIRYLYYKFYKAQIYVGNRDVAPFFAMLMLLAIFWFYILDIVLLLGLFIDFKIHAVSERNFKIIAIIISLASFCYIFYKRRYKKIIENPEFKEVSNKSAIIFSTLPFLFFFIFFLIIMIIRGQNI